MNEAIPEEWIKSYVDQLLDMAGRLGDDSPMRSAALLRAEHAMDLLTAWRESRQRRTTEGNT